MKKYDKKSAIKIIVHAAKEYEEKLNNKHFLIVYQKKSLTKTVEIGFRDMNFLHLTGVETRLSAKDFYKNAKKATLSNNQFYFNARHPYANAKKKLPCLKRLHARKDRLLLARFAAGAMLYVEVEKLIPEMSQGQHLNIGTLFFALGYQEGILLQ